MKPNKPFSLLLVTATLFACSKPTIIEISTADGIDKLTQLATTASVNKAKNYLKTLNITMSETRSEDDEITDKVVATVSVDFKNTYLYLVQAIDTSKVETSVYKEDDKYYLVKKDGPSYTKTTITKDKADEEINVYLDYVIVAPFILDTLEEEPNGVVFYTKGSNFIVTHTVDKDTGKYELTKLGLVEVMTVRSYQYSDEEDYVEQYLSSIIYNKTIKRTTISPY
jgi:hypothetical protein